MFLLKIYLGFYDENKIYTVCVNNHKYQVQREILNVYTRLDIYGYIDYFTLQIHCHSDSVTVSDLENRKCCNKDRFHDCFN